MSDVRPVHRELLRHLTRTAEFGQSWMVVQGRRMGLVVPTEEGGHEFAAGYFKTTVVQALLSGLVELGPPVSSAERPTYTGGGLRWTDRGQGARTITLLPPVPPESGPAPAPPVRISGMQPGSTRWRAAMSASKIAAVMGLSPYESRRSVWEMMAGNLPPEPPRKNKQRGHYMEGGVAAWWADQHPDWAVLPGGTWAHSSDPWMIASPDRRLVPMCACGRHVTEGCCDTLDCEPCCRACPTCPTLDHPPAALLELKTDAEGSEWGSGPEDIPVGYRCQVLWQMLVLGVREVRVAVLSSYLDLREYVITWDQKEIDVLVAEANAFRLSLQYGEPPELDGDDATYAAMRSKHPDLDPQKTITLTDAQARELLEAEQEEKAGKAQWTLARARVTELMDGAGVATWNDRTVAVRRARKGVKPWVEVPKGRPDLESIPGGADVDPLDWSGLEVAS
ncbi:YqaJ viral recombinase family protein [Nocardiopsis flavescens]|uniref:YqaJ viral recombinase family protein n=1 Tax=Nocardiopsis flavescens TaxID=758803 RepID=UPI00365D80CF